MATLLSRAYARPVLGVAETSRSLDLTGRVAVVTGAARGIGRASAVALAQAGASIAGIDIAGPVSDSVQVAAATVEELERTGELVRGAGSPWSAHRVDQRDITALRSAAEAIAARYGGVDILHANAGIQAFCAILDMHDADWHDQIDVNLSGTANVVRVFAPILVARGGGRIIITSSTQGQHGTKYGAAYAASKWGLLGLMKSAALELGQHHITVNAVIPGLVDTALTRHGQRYAQSIEEGGGTPSGNPGRDEEVAVRGLIAKTPLGVPWVEPEDVAPLVAFLASDAARMVSGTSFAATGGDSAHVTA